MEQPTVYSLRDLANQYDGSLITEDVSVTEDNEVAREISLVKRMHESQKSNEITAPKAPVNPSIY